MSSYLKKPSGLDSLFGNFDNKEARKDINSINQSVVDIDKLHEFKEHPFKLYTGERFEKMKESISTLGILEPVLVRKQDEEYEILSGHNRVNAAKELGIKEVPIRILENIDNELAMLIVTESNIIQRSFSELSHSEKAVIIKNHMDACRCRGKRNDLVKAIDELLGKDIEVINKEDNLENAGVLYEMSRKSVARYLRINYLISDLKNMLDNGELGMYAGVSLSYISAEMQEEIYDVYNSGEYKIDAKKAEQLRQISERQELNRENIEEILSGTPKKKSNLTFKNFNIDNFFNKYFSPLQEKKEIVNELTAALEILKKLKDGDIEIVEKNKSAVAESEIKNHDEYDMEMME